MKKRWLIGFLLIAMGLFFFWRFLNGGPTYEGKNAKQWFERYCRTGSYGAYNDVDHLEARLALAHLGGNAIQLLNDEAQNPRPDTGIAKIKHQLRRLLSRENIGPYIPGIYVALEARSALKEIRPPASVVLPLVADALKHPEDTTNYCSALFLLGYVGEGAEQGVPALAQGLRGTNELAHDLAAQSLANIGRKARGALPEMIEDLKRGDISSCPALANLGEEAREALPLLDKKFSSATTNELFDLATTIYAIDPSRRDAIAFIRTRLAGDDNRKREVLTWLREIGPVAKEFIPDCVTLANSTNDAVQATAIYTLAGIFTNDALIVLRQKMSTSPINVRVWVAGWILRIHPNDTEAVEVLTKQLADPLQNNLWGSYAMEQLGDVTFEQKDVIALLEKYAQSSDSFTRDRARRTLKNIKLKEKQQKMGMRHLGLQ